MIINGKEIASKIERDLSNRARDFEKRYGKKVTLHTVLVGNDEASRIYANSKIKKLKSLGMDGYIHTLPENSSENEIIDLLKKLSADENVHGIMVEMPLPKHLDKTKILMNIDPEKDADGQNPLNLGLLMLGNEDHVPSTPKAVIRIIEETGIDLKGKRVCIINRTPVVGKPLAMLFLNRDATVKICHSKTLNIENETRDSDIIVVAVGKPFFLKENMVTEKSIVIDVGINSVENKIVGDADFESLKDKVSMITPVPGGVGSVTTVLIIEQTIKNAERIMEKKFM